MTYPQDRSYASTHEWLKEDGDVAYIGITDHAQGEMGDLVFIELPEVGDEVVAGEAFGNLESVKAVSEIVSPASGTVIEVNEEVLDEPACVNDDAHGSWLIKIENVQASEGLLDSTSYEALL